MDNESIDQTTPSAKSSPKFSSKRPGTFGIKPLTLGQNLDRIVKSPLTELKAQRKASRYNNGTTI
jgi:hypothetical protein